jgi:guanylate kinase
VSEYKGKIIVVSGPSGSGKSSLIREIVQCVTNCYISISTTTRHKRGAEEDGVDYHFVSKEEFIEDIDNNNFLEYAIVHDNYYGTSLKPVTKALQDGKLVIFDIDVQGNEAIKKRFDDITTSVFLTTPTLQELETRLRGRGTDSEEVIQRRVAMAKEEIARAGEYDFLIVNDEFNATLQKILFVIDAAKLKMSVVQMENFIAKWVG